MMLMLMLMLLLLPLLLLLMMMMINIIIMKKRERESDRNQCTYSENASGQKHYVDLHLTISRTLVIGRGIITHHAWYVPLMTSSLVVT